MLLPVHGDESLCPNIIQWERLISHSNRILKKQYFNDNDNNLSQMIYFIMKHIAQAFVREACRFLESLKAKGVTAHLLVYWNQLKFQIW